MAEELRQDVRVLGLLDDMVTRSQLVVTPVLGRIEVHPYGSRLRRQEVAELLEVSLSHLWDPANHVPPPAIQRTTSAGDHVIFGARAIMTAGSRPCCLVALSLPV